MPLGGFHVGRPMIGLPAELGRAAGDIVVGDNRPPKATRNVASSANADGAAGWQRQASGGEE